MKPAGVGTVEVGVETIVVVVKVVNVMKERSVSAFEIISSIGQKKNSFCVNRLTRQQPRHDVS